MNKRKIVSVVVLGIFVVGIIGMMGYGGRGAQKNVNRQQQGANDEMVSRMYARQQSNNDILNANMATIKFSEAVGKVAPDFTLTKQDGSTFTLSNYKNKIVVLFFSGGAMCYPACWDQIESLGKDERFNNDEVVAVSIVIDEKKEWDKIISSQPKFGVATLLFDTNRTVSKAYDMLSVPSSMHEGTSPGHTYLIIKDGVISYVLDDPKMALNTDQVESNLQMLR